MSQLEQNTQNENKKEFILVDHQSAPIKPSRSWCGCKPFIVICSLAVLGLVIAITLTLTLTFIYLPKRGHSPVSNNSDAIISIKIDEYIKVEMQNRKIPGISLAILRNGEIIHGKGYGYSNIEHNVNVKLETVFQSGSVGKQFTSMGIMLLVERRIIGLDDKINKYFVDAPLEWNNITVRHLLTHTSGMGDYPNDFNFRNDYTEDEIYRIITKVPLHFEPGEEHAYSNFGYLMLGFLIRRLTNRFYGDFLKEFIFDHLQMTTAQIINEADIIPNRASGYILINNQIKNQIWVSPSVNTGADGSLYLTVYDMAKWDAALYQDKLLKNQTSFDIMWNPVKLNNNQTRPYGFGWRLAEAINGMKIIYHTGSWQGFRSSFMRVPDYKLSVILFANQNELPVNDLTEQILQFYNPQLAFKPLKHNIQQTISRYD